MTTERKGYRSRDWNNKQQHRRKVANQRKEPDPSESRFLQELRFSRGMKDLALYWRQLGWGHLF